VNAHLTLQVRRCLAAEVLATPRRYSNMRSIQPRFKEAGLWRPFRLLRPVASALTRNIANYERADAEMEGWRQAVSRGESFPRGEGSISKRVRESPRRYFGAQSMQDRSLARKATSANPAGDLVYNPDFGKYRSVATAIQVLHRRAAPTSSASNSARLASENLTILTTCRRQRCTTQR
jgi:hypothetical protein